MTTVSTSLRTAMAQALYDTIGASPVVSIYDASSTLLVTFYLPSTWGSVSGGAVVVDEAVSIAAASGTASNYVFASSGGSPHITGSVTERDGGGDLTLDRTSLIIGMPVVITSWRLRV